PANGGNKIAAPKLCCSWAVSHWLSAISNGPPKNSGKLPASVESAAIKRASHNVRVISRRWRSQRANTIGPARCCSDLWQFTTRLEKNIIRLGIALNSGRSLRVTDNTPRRDSNLRGLKVLFNS